MIIDIIGWEIGEAPRARREGTHKDEGRAHSQTAQTHYMNADVTLACERCCVTNGYMGSIVAWVSGVPSPLPHLKSPLP